MSEPNPVTITACHVDGLPVETELVDLYLSVGWTAYTDRPPVLLEGLRRSLRVVVARDQAGRLVGLARVVGDGATICYLQDVLVRPDTHRAGVGTRLVAAAFEPYATVRQHVLLTDEEPGQKAFYESLGFRQVGSTPAPGRAFIRFS